MVSRLTGKGNTRISVRTLQDAETSERIQFNKGLPQGDALCLRLFTLSLNSVAWKLKATEGYRLSKPISAKITNVLHTDDMKMYAASEGKLGRVMKETRGTMSDIGLKWNERKCAVVHVKRGQLEDSTGMTTGAPELIKSLNKSSQYRFLGVLENKKQEDNMVLENVEKEYLKRVSMIWSSPLSDYKVLANQLICAPGDDILHVASGLAHH